MSRPATLWTLAQHAPLSMGFSRREYWSGLPCPPPEDLPDPRIEPWSPVLQAGSLPHSDSYYFNFSLSVKVARVLQSCATLCTLMDCSPPGSCVHGLFQARILEWVAISFSRVSSQPRGQTHVSCISVGRQILYH